MMIHIDTLIETANRLEPLPSSLTRLATLVADDDSDIREIVDVVSFDQALTLRLLKVANSAFSASIMEITNVRAAVLRLGKGMVLSIAMGTAVKGSLSRALPQYGLSQGDLWLHSVTAALAAETMGKFCKATISPAAFTAALLHDIGKLVVAGFLTPDIQSYLDRAMREGCLTRMQAERELLEVHHGELGGLIAQNWELPESIVKGISYHHTPEEDYNEETKPTCYSVHLANWIAKYIDLEEPPEDFWPAEVHVSREFLGMTEESLKSVCELVAQKRKDMPERY
ncbi:MAG: HDOD domain-containing protein [Candidatus Eisenbacteria bacterium]|uniref:HDOD domain-containing protein n=1 Tax=Eiseniibacteriota bacterium TaxID=2212470 RepID=A0A948RY87_UNCEI|nr:HDOD domain-containing protein [Candidatus Eisenbacteria bacterium]MBU1950574.1 HDOD domain-containing protein [Candidatus Eisenbacteria bacterium]MBU2693228.1 HDOD domain-containing protein [Candidatus Eisenbacteria bacterium]